MANKYRMDEQDAAVRVADCKLCGAAKGERCRTVRRSKVRSRGGNTEPHDIRMRDYFGQYRETATVEGVKFAAADMQREPTDGDVCE